MTGINRFYDNDPTLKKICFWWEQVGDAGAEEIADALKINTTLKELELWFNNIGDSGPRRLPMR